MKAVSVSDLPFDGLKVVDLSQGVAGPHCGMLMAQHGADVVKVEPHPVRELVHCVSAANLPKTSDPWLKAKATSVR